MRRIALVASVLAALAAGVLAGRSPHDAASVARLDAARTSGRDALAGARTPQAQRAAALRLATVYRTAARHAPAPTGRTLAAGVDAYTEFAGATADRSRFDAARGRVAAAETALAATLAARPRGPAHWPAVPLALAALALAALASRRRLPPGPLATGRSRLSRRPRPAPATSPRPVFRDVRCRDFVSWDAPPPEPASPPLPLGD